MIFIFYSIAKYVCKRVFFSKNNYLCIVQIYNNIWNLRILKKIVSNIIKYVLPLILGLSIFWLLYRQFDAKEILSILQSDINYFWIFVAMLSGVLSFIIRALRWQQQLRVLHIDPPFSSICNAIFGTFAFNLIFPRFGELWRCTYLSNRESASFSRIFGSMLGERTVDTIVAITIICAVFLSQMGIVSNFLSQNPNLQENIQGILLSPWLYLAIVVLAIAGYFIFSNKGTNSLLNKFRDSLQKMGEGFKSILSMKSGKLLFWFYSIAIWGCYFMQLYFCALAFDWMSHITIMQALVLFVLGSLGTAVPVQGGIGPWHAAVIFGMLFYGFTYQQAGAFALVAHGAPMIMTILLGIYATISIFFEKKHLKTT